MFGTMKCIYETPCRWCSKWDKKCDCKIGCENPTKSVETISIPVKNFNKPIDIPHTLCQQNKEN